jgi:signal transduction histidine kinase
MRATAWRPNAFDLAWVAFALLNLVAMAAWPRWETIPFHLIWFTLTLLYGFRVWALPATGAVLVVMGIATGVLIFHDAENGDQAWGELFEIPLMSMMFLAMVWHARRRRDAIGALQSEASQRAKMLREQEQFLHDVSHELRTPVTIARGHLELLERADGDGHAEVDVALDELKRIERIVERLLLLARAGQQDLTPTSEIELEWFLEDVLMRWAEVTPRAWRLGPLAEGTLRADPEALRIALDSLLENAVKHTDRTDAIEIRSEARGERIAISVADEGAGIPPAALGRIFERFHRADDAHARVDGGVGLGLAIVDTIARAHGGTCAVTSSTEGSTFKLILPGFRSARAPASANGYDALGERQAILGQ